MTAPTRATPWSDPWHLQNPKDDFESFDREYNMMIRVSDVPALDRYALRMIKANLDSDVMVLSIPNTRWRTLLVQIEAEHFVLDQILN